MELLPKEGSTVVRVDYLDDGLSDDVYALLLKLFTLPCGTPFLAPTPKTFFLHPSRALNVKSPLWGVANNEET